MLSLKEKVLSFVQAKGPVLPVQISKETGRDLFFSGAILSELVSNKVIKISHAKIGGSPVYYIQGQEAKLSMLYDGLPMREKEAYNLLKEKKILKDDEVNPGIRVALRMIKDFAIPLSIKKGNKEELIWKWYLAPNEAITSQIKQPLQEIKKPQPALPPKPRRIEQAKQKTIQPKIYFLQDIARYIKQNNIMIREETMVRKNREFDLIVSIPSNIGNIDYVVNAKNKKTLNEADLTLAYQKGQSKKLPVILLTNGELTKKAKAYREKNLKGYVLVKNL